MKISIPLTVIAILSFSLPAFATPLFTFSKITSEADVINNGNILRATNLGNSSQGTFNPVTVNGVNFDTSTTGLTGLVPGGGDFNTEPGFVGTPLGDLLSGTWYQNGSSSSLTLTGLTVGEDYTYQMFISNDHNSTGHNSRVTFQGQQFQLNSAIYPYGGGGYSLQVDFEAQSGTEVVGFGTGSTSESARMQFNAFSLQTTSVPAPAAIWTLLLGLSVLTMQRKKHANA